MQLHRDEYEGYHQIQKRGKSNSVNEVDSLGAKLTKKHLTRRELENRLGKAMMTVKKLKDFFTKANCNVAWKLQVYNAVIVSRLLYGLESLELIDSLKTRLDAFQIRGLRQILKIKHSFWSHTSNIEIIVKANMTVERAEHIDWQQFIVCRDIKDMKVKLISQMLEDRKVRLLGHILRCDERDPLIAVTLDSDYKRLMFDKRRVGRPRNHWTEMTMNSAYQKVYDCTFEVNDDTHRLMLITAALDRLF